MKIFKYEIGDICYLKTDNDQLERIVTGIMIRPSGIIFCLGQSNTESWHYDIEISTDKDLVKSMS